MTQEQAVILASSFGYTPDMLDAITAEYTALFPKETRIASLKRIVKKVAVAKVVDEESTKYLGYYEFVVNLPILREMFDVPADCPLTLLASEISRYAIACKTAGHIA